MTPRVGDVVHVRGTVKPMRDGLGVEFELGPPLSRAILNIHQDAIIHIEPAPLKVGDRVKHRFDAIEGKIVAIHEAWAWIYDEDIYHTCSWTNLERLP